MDVSKGVRWATVSSRAEPKQGENDIELLEGEDIDYEEESPFKVALSAD